jgi:ABC-type Fe3+ transport system substrate-binding protein
MSNLGGVSAGEKYFSTLKANGLVIHPTNGPTLQALTSGQINLALVQSSAAIGATLSAKNIGITYLSPATLLPSAIGIDAKASPQVQAEGKKFAGFVLSAAGQPARSHPLLAGWRRSGPAAASPARHAGLLARPARVHRGALRVLPRALPVPPPV